MASMAYALNEEMVRGLLKSLNLTQASAAAEMGMHRQHFHRLLQKSKIEDPLKKEMLKASR